MGLTNLSLEALEGVPPLPGCPYVFYDPETKIRWLQKEEFCRDGLPESHNLQDAELFCAYFDLISLSRVLFDIDPWISALGYVSFIFDST